MVRTYGANSQNPAGSSPHVRNSDESVRRRVRRTVATRGLLTWFCCYKVGTRDRLFKIAGIPSPGDTGRPVRCRHSGRKADFQPGRRPINQVSWCATRRRAGCSGGEYYANVSAHATFCSKERVSYRRAVRYDGSDAAYPVGRPTSGRKFGKLPPESPRLGGLEV